MLCRTLSLFSDCLKERRILWRRDMWAGSGVELSKVDWVWMVSPFRKSTTVKPYTHPTAILRERK